MSRRQDREMKRTADGLENVIAKLGRQSSEMFGATRYAPNYLTRQRQQLEFMYRDSFIVGRVVDCVAQDMVRGGIDLSGSADPSATDAIQKKMARLKIWQRIESGIKWARLYGGSILVLLIEGQEMSTPLRPETVGKGQFKGLADFDRWQIDITAAPKITELGPDLGLPEYYHIHSGSRVLAGQRIHHSRVIRLIGTELPYWPSFSEMGWGMSVIERLFDRLVGFDSATQGAAQLVYKAYLRTIKVKGLKAALAAGGPAEEALSKRFDSIRKFQSSEGLTLLDGDDDFITNTYTFAGLDDVLMQFAQQLSGACEIPLVRLFGQTPTGLNTSGDSDIRAYYDMILKNQNSSLDHPMEKIVDLTSRSCGYDGAADLQIEFNPLWQMSEKERADISNIKTSSVSSAFSEGLISQRTALMELRATSRETGMWNTITDADIEAAQDEVVPETPDLLGGDGDLLDGSANLLPGEDPIQKAIEAGDEIAGK